MKKTAKVILRAFFAIALITSVGFLSGRAIAASNPLTVTDASVTAKSDGVTAEISKVENNEITNSVTFNKVDDSVTFKLSIKNTGDKKLTIKSVADDNSNEFIGYSYEEYAGTELDAGVSFNFILKATYKKAVADISARNQSFNVSFSFAYETETGETGEQAVVVTPETPKTAEASNTPNTLDNILHYLGIFALAAAGLVLSIFLIKSANKKIKTAGLAIALVMAAALAMPIIANANDDLAPIKFVNEYALMDRIVVTYNDGTADHTVEINNGDTIDLDDAEVPGYNFGGWEDEDGNEFDPTQPITGDITIHPVLDPIHYTIAIDTDGDGDADLTIPATYGEPVELPNNEADKPGHTPNGWTDGTNHYSDGEEVSDLTTTDGDTVNLSPDFTPNHFVAEIDTDGDGQVDHTIDVTYGEPANLPTNEAEMPGHTPDGWKDGDGNHYDNNADISDLLVDNDGTISFEPDFTPNHYNIEIDTDGDGDVDVTIPATYGEPVELPTNTATGETGTIPDGWKDGDGNHYDSGEEVINLTDENNGTVSLEPNFSPIRYTVVFNKEGGESETTTLAYGDSYTIPSDGGQKEGYRFSSWTGSNGGSYAKGGTISKLTAIDGATITFTPNWQENYYEIYFPRTKNATGATISSINYINYTQDVSLPQNTYVTNNYYADGYNTANDGTGTHYNEGQVVSRLVSEHNGQIALYTDWRPMNYKLVFDKNSDEATGTMAAQSCTYGVTCTLPENSFTYVGHNFKNWQYAANTLSVPGNNVFVNNLTENGQEVSVKAIWGVNYYRVYIHRENGTAYKNFSPAYDEDISERLATYATELAQTGYTIDHWNTKADGSGDTYLPGQAVSKLAGQTHASGDTVDLYPTFRKISYHVAIDTDGDGDADINEDLEYGQGYTLPSTAQAEEGYTPTGWTDGTNQYSLGETINNLTTEDGSTITLTPVFELKHYTLKVDTDGDWSYDDRETAVVYGQTSIVLELDTATISTNNPGRTPTGWTDGTNHYAEDADFGSLNVDNNATVYLRPDYRPNEYDVWLDSDNDGTYEKTYHVVYGGEHIYLDTNTYSEVGYLPAGWISDTHVVYGDGIDMSSLPKDDGVVIKLSPYLVSIDYYVEFDYDGDGVVDETDTYSYTREVVLATNTASKPGYTPNGWTDGTHHFDNNTHVNKLTSVNHATVRISPDWIQDQYTVTLDPGNGTLSAGPIEGVYGDEVNLPTPTAQTSEKFTGWYTDATEGEKVSSPYTLIGTTTLYAHYRELATEATFGSGSFVNQIMKNINPNVVTFRKYPTDPQPDDDYTGYSEVSDENSPAKIYLWQDPNDEDTINWWTEAPVAYVNTNYGNNMFYTLGKLKNIDLTDIDVSRAKSLARFFSSTAITEIDLSGWNTQNVTSMTSMFSDCSALESVTFGQNFNTSKVTNMSLMFDSNSSLQSLDLSMFNTEKVTNMMAMFRSVKMTELDLSSFSTPALTNIKLMFIGADQLQTIYVGEGWNTDHVTQSNGTDANANDYSVFGNNFNLVGGAGTIYSASNPKHKPYARIDNPDNNEPGYFTLKNKRYVRFDANGGEGAMNSRYMASGDTLPGNDFARENHTFTGWNTQADGGGTSYSDKAALNMTISKTPLTLYAQWEEIRGVLYHANGQGVEGSMSIQDASAGDSVELKSTNFSRAGYGFAGWNTKADGTGVTYGPNQTIIMPEGVVFDLYAMWIAPEQDVTMQTFDASAEPYASAAIGTVKALRDIRDDNVYTVAKLADGKWWMTENLRLDLSTHGDKINSSNTHNPLDSFITEASVKPESAPFGSAACSPQPDCLNTIRFVDKHITRADDNMVYGNGVFYNWHVATAGHGANMTIEGTSTEGDICSRGWHLPTGKNTTTGEYYALARAIYNSDTPPTDDDSKFTEAPNNFLHSGWGSDASNLQYGYYWTSTFRRLTSTIGNAYDFTFAKGYVSYTSAPARGALLSVRCVAD